jgi:hypothetical protein
VDCAAGQVPGREEQWAVGLMPEIGGIVVVCRRTRCGEGRIRTPAGGSNSHSFLRRTVVPETDRLARGGEMGTESHRAYIIDGSSLLPKLRVCQVHKPIFAVCSQANPADVTTEARQAGTTTSSEEMQAFIVGPLVQRCS